MPREEIPDFDEAPVMMNDADVAAAQAGLDVPAPAPAPEPTPTTTPAPTPDKPAVEPIKETTPDIVTAEGVETTPPDPLEEIRAQLAQAQHDNKFMRAAFEEFLKSGKFPEVQPTEEPPVEEPPFPELDLTEDELIEAETSSAARRAVYKKIAQQTATNTEQIMLRRIQTVIPKVIVNAVNNELMRRENVAKGDRWEADHPEFAGQSDRLKEILLRERQAHPDWSADKLLEELGPIASKELHVPLKKTGAATPPTPTITPTTRPVASAAQKLTDEERDVLDMNKVLGKT